MENNIDKIRKNPLVGLKAFEIEKLNNEHFGNSPMRQFEKVVNALDKCEQTMQTWTRSHSIFTWKNMTIGGEYTPYRQLRQIAAQLKNKKAAMIEAKYKWLKKKKKAEIKRRDIENEEDVLKREYLEIEAAELEETSELMYQPYIGAMKDVLELTKLHDSIIDGIKQKYGKFDEEVFEKEEAKYWVKRAFSQSMRDVRERGIITKGEQELLEQIGINPAIAKDIIIRFLNSEKIENGATLSTEKQEIFIDECAEQFFAESVNKLRRLGLPENIDNETLLLDNGE